MGKSMQDKRFTDDQIVVEPSTQRRSFLGLLSRGVIGVTGVAAGIGGMEQAQAASSSSFESLWNSAQVFIGNSPEDQIANPVINCPLFFDNGHFANGFHTLDLSRFPQVRGTITLGDNTIEPDFRYSVAAATTLSTDGLPYLIVAGQGTVTGGTGYFRGVTKAIIRCQYKVADLANFLLIACVDCVVILVRG